ncbi:DUF1232 domain-containing protein [Candidatus Dojkabacteria bacterium]|uniref:DUF1232 domain-containing protein n=1 Tax=Candidatus Dojkabacteria bacterium TaxID=2099670 RepID=A0A955I9T0_9BACT|nr:DUF1232 domain-containing protein [Candidatus Dojkabacteria bacterium]
MKKFFKENWLIILSVLYIIFPLDFIPDFIPWVGFGDDITVVATNLLVTWLKKKSARSS